MAIFSAHYALTPNGTFIKYPLLHVSDKGEIIKLESTGNSYKEKHSAQFFSGILVPGLITDLRLFCKTNTTETIIKTIWHQFSNGVAFITLPSELENNQEFKKIQGPKLIFNDAIYCCDEYNNPWENLKQSISLSNTTIEQTVSTFYSKIWQNNSDSLKAGKFEIGFQPSINCISGIDWQTEKLLPNATITRLKP